MDRYFCYSGYEQICVISTELNNVIHGCQLSQTKETKTTCRPTNKDQLPPQQLTKSYFNSSFSVHANKLKATEIAFSIAHTGYLYLLL